MHLLIVIHFQIPHKKTTMKLNSIDTLPDRMF